MKYLFSMRLAGLVVFAGVCLAPGCGKKLPPMAPVSGKVTVGGQPLTAGQVSLVPEFNPMTEEGKKSGAPSTAGLSAGQINSDGTYKISTSGHDGAPLGKYKITVSPSMMPTGNDKAPPSSFNASYSNPQQTKLQFEVIASPEPGRYDLKLSK